ncbi:MAG: phosphotransferase [Candidatus Uhrbacteria bacterium]
MTEGGIAKIETPQGRQDIRSVEAGEETRVRVEKLIRAYLDAGVIGVGNNARVFAEPIVGSAGTWCAKDVLTLDFRTAHNSPYDEFLIQEAAYRAVEKTRADGIDLARVPEPVAYIETVHNGTEHRIVVMERIVGKTIFRLLLESLVRGNERCADLRPELNEMADDVLEEQILIRFNLRRKSTREQLRTLVTLGKAAGFRVPRATVTKVRATIQTLHGEGVYHRDGHPRNLMVDAQTGEPFLIDFGRSTKVAAGTLASEVYEDFVGEQLLVFVPDEELVIFLRGLMDATPASP